MSNSRYQISTIIAERFVDAIAKIKAEAARVMAEQTANIEAQTEEKIAGYCEEITQLKNQLEQNSQDHAEEIAKITSDAHESIAKEKTRADEAAEQIVKARTEIADAITEQKEKIETQLSESIVKTKAEYEEQIAKVKSEATEAIAKEKAIADEAVEQVARLKAETEEKQEIHTEQTSEENNGPGIEEFVAEKKAELETQAEDVITKVATELEQPIADIEAKRERQIVEIATQGESSVETEEKQSDEAVEQVANVKTEAHETTEEQELEEKIEAGTEELIVEQKMKLEAQAKEVIAEIMAKFEQSIADIKAAYEQQVAKVRSQTEAELDVAKKRLSGNTDTQREQNNFSDRLDETDLADVSHEQADILSVIKDIDGQIDTAVEVKGTLEAELDDIKAEQKAEETSEDEPAEVQAQIQEQIDQTEPASKENTEENVEVVEEVNSETSEKTDEVDTDSSDSAVEEKAVTETEDKQPATGEVSKAIEKMVESTAVLPGGYDSLPSTLCAKDIMKKDLVWANPDDSVQQALTKIKQTDNGYLIVGKDETIEGIVSNSDLNGAVSAYLRPEFAKWRRPLDDATLQIRIKWIMSRPVHIIRPQTPLATIMRNMSRLRVCALPVVDQQDKVLGLVTEADIFEALLKQQNGANLSASSKADQQQPTPDNLSDPTKRMESSLATAG